MTVSSDPTAEAAEASTYVAKYAGLVVTNAVENWQMLPVLTADRISIPTRKSR